MPRRLLQHGGLCVTEAVDRLLPIPDDEDRRVSGNARAFAPGLDEQRHELPLRAARVLELVDEHVVIARFEPEPALRELVHPAQQLERAIEHVGEVEDGSLVEHLAVLRQRNGEHPPDAAREHDVEVAVEGEDHLGDARRDGQTRPPDAVWPLRRRIVVRAVGVNDAARARLARRRSGNGRAMRSSTARNAASPARPSSGKRRMSRTSS